MIAVNKNTVIFTVIFSQLAKIASDGIPYPISSFSARAAL